MQQLRDSLEKTCFVKFPPKKQQKLAIHAIYYHTLRIQDINPKNLKIWKCLGFDFEDPKSSKNIKFVEIYDFSRFGFFLKISNLLKYLTSQDLGFSLKYQICWNIWVFKIFTPKPHVTQYMIFVHFSPQTHFLVQFFSTQKRVNRDKKFLTKQRKSPQNWF